VALQGKYPPGGVFRMITTLALSRAGVGAESVSDCTPALIDHQRFTNPATSATGISVPFPRVFATDCRTAFARAAAGMRAADLDAAARALGFAVASSTGARAFDGVITTPDDPLAVVQDALGEGTTLASPLAMARVAATVATGNQRPPTLVLPVTPSSPAAPQAALSSIEQGLLGGLMRGSVQTDPQLTPLRSAFSGDLAAVAGTAGYGPADNARVHAWCVGYRGTVAFAAFVAGTTPTGSLDRFQARKAAVVAARLLGAD
jgi:cell division protein FtsI/penicillin-binding protein 2